MSATVFSPSAIYATAAGLIGANESGQCELLSAEDVKALAGLSPADSPTFAGMTLNGNLQANGELRSLNGVYSNRLYMQGGVALLGNQAGHSLQHSPQGLYLYGSELVFAINGSKSYLKSLGDGSLQILRNDNLTQGTLQAASIANQSGNVDLTSNSVVGLRVNNAVVTTMPGAASPRLDMGSSGFRIVRSGNNGQIIVSNPGSHLKLMASDGLIARNETDTADAPVSAGAITSSGNVDTPHFISGNQNYGWGAFNGIALKGPGSLLLSNGTFANNRFVGDFAGYYIYSQSRLLGNVNCLVLGANATLRSQSRFGWSSSSNPVTDVPDTAMGRVSAGIVEINNGTPVASGGTLGNLIISDLTTTSITSTSGVNFRSGFSHTINFNTSTPYYNLHRDLGARYHKNLKFGWTSGIHATQGGMGLGFAHTNDSTASLTLANGTSFGNLQVAKLIASEAIGVFGSTPPASQPAAIDDATDLVSALTSLNSLLAAARSYGLIAS